jgi:hypothetical protein
LELEFGASVVQLLAGAGTEKLSKGSKPVAS